MFWRNILQRLHEAYHGFIYECIGFNFVATVSLDARVDHFYGDYQGWIIRLCTYSANLWEAFL